MAWRDVVVFLGIAYAFTWGWDAIFIAPHLIPLLTAPTTPTDPTMVFGNMLLHLPAMFGPMLAAIVMRLWVSREGLRGSLRWRQPWRLYAVAILAPMIFLALFGLVALFTGLATAAPLTEPFTAIILPLLVVLFLLESVLAFGEEYGWRGYLLPKLLPLGEVRATIVLGTVWAFWHFPVLLAGVILGGYPLWIVVPVHLFLVIAGAFPYTWLGKASGHNPVLAALFHGANNWGQQRLLMFLAFGSLLGAIAMIGLGWLAVVLVYYGLRWLRRRGIASARV